MKSKVLENKRKKEENLLASALELFSYNDIKHVTIQDIVDKAGVAKGTFYLYFKDKYEIQNRLIHQESVKLFQEAYSKLDEKNIQNFEDRIIGLVDQILISLESNPFILQFIRRDLSIGLFQNQVNSFIIKDECNILHQFKEQAIECGYHFDDPEIIFYIIFELVGSASHTSIMYQQPKPIEELKPHLFNCIRSILKQGKIE